MSGYDEVSLTSLSTTDHSCIRDVLGRLNRRLEDTGIRVSIPSQRLDSFGVDMAESVAGEKKGGLTFAPEAGSQRMRDIINKNVTEEDLDRAAKARSSITMTSSAARSCSSRACATAPFAYITTMPRPRLSRLRSPVPVAI